VNDCRVQPAAHLAPPRSRFDRLDAARHDGRAAAKLRRAEHDGDAPATHTGRLAAPDSLGRWHRRWPEEVATTGRRSAYDRNRRPFCRALGLRRDLAAGSYRPARQCRARPRDPSPRRVPHAGSLPRPRYSVVSGHRYFQVTALPSLATVRYTWLAMPGIMSHP